MLLRKLEEVDENVIKALDMLGYFQRTLRGVSLHARRGSDHLIVKLTKSGKLKGVSGHRDVMDTRYKRYHNMFHVHRAIKGEIARKLQDEFKKAYENAKSSPE